MKPLSSEEQKAALGGVYRKPVQIDLLSGEATVKKPKAGNGAHIVLKQTGKEPSVAVGMAHFPGTGPKKKYCRDCEHCRDLWTRGKRSRLVTEACAKFEDIMGVVGRGGIGANRSCKYFVAKSEGQ